jgi:WD40 repeat protein
MLMTETSDPGTFQIVTIPISRYQHHPPLDQIEIEANRIIDLFREFGGQVGSRPSGDQSLDEATVKSLLRDWATRTSPSGVLLWLGHGASDGDDAWLASFETPDPINGNGIVPKTVADQIDSDWRQRAADDTAWALVIIEACGAGRFVNNMVSELAKNSPRRLAMFGIGGDGAAYLGRFGDALSRTAAGYTVNDERVRLRDFINRLQDFLLREDEFFPFQVDNQLLLHRQRLIDTPISAPIDFYQEFVKFLATLLPDERSHFIPKAQGAEHGELAWYFVGRVAERRKISAWLRDSTGGMLIVTGRAGTGKSALLGNVLVHTNPALRELLIQGGQLQREAATELPPDHAFDAVVHLTGMTTSELVARVAEAAGVALPTAESAESGQDLEAVLANLRDRSFTIMADALDEAQEPATIASTVLQRLATLPRTRVIVGTRASTKEGPDQPFTTDQDLLDALSRGHVTIMRIERDPEAISAYVRRRLAASLAGQTEATEGAAERVVALSSGREREFLFARLAVHEIIARPALLLPEFREELETLLGGDHRALFAATVARLTADSRTTRQLLEALALARGRGVPRADRIWATVAGAIAGGEAPREIDIDQLLAAAAPYVMLDAEDGQSVYRLAHQTFREFFLSSGDTDLPALHGSVARALIANVGGAEAINPYIVHRLAEYVAEAGAWQELADAPAILDELDPESIAAEALRTAYGRANLPLAIAASLSARHLLSSVAVADRWMTRQITMACIESADAQIATGGKPTASWAWLRHHDPLHVLLIGHIAPIRAASALHMADGRVLLATGADDGTIRLWDPSTGRPVGDPLEEAGSPGFRIAAFHSGDGRTLLAIGGKDGRLRLWDPGSGQFHSDSLAGHKGSILDIVCFTREGREDVIVTCGFDGTLLVWQVTVGQPITNRPLVTDYRVRAMSSLPVPSGRTLLVTGGYNGDVQLWDSLTGQPHGDRLTGHSGAVRAVATLMLLDGRQFVVAGGDDAIRVWDSRGDPSGGRLLAGHSGAVHAVVALPLAGGRTLIASGGEDAIVRLWDPVTGHAEGEPLTGHKHPVHALATVALRDGRTLLASGGEDNTVRIWDPSLTRRTSKRPGRRAPRLHTLAAAMLHGRALLMTGDDEGVIQLRDPRTGASAGQPISGEAVSIHAITAIGLPDGGTMVAASGAGGSVARWILHPERPARPAAPLYGHAGTVRAITSLPFPSGQLGLASAGNDDKIRLWEPLTGKPAGVLVGGHRRTVSALMAVRTERGQPLLASAGDDPAVILWDLAAPLTPAARVRAAEAASFSSLALVAGPAGEVWLAAGARDGSICLWNTGNSQLTGILSAVGDAVLSLATLRLPSGRELLAAGSADGRLRLWDAIDGTLLRTVPLPFDQWAQNLIATGTAVAIQTDTGVIVSELDPALAAISPLGSKTNPS